MKLSVTCIVVLTLALGAAADADAQGTILWASTSGRPPPSEPGDLPEIPGGGHVYRIDPVLKTVTLVGDSGFDKLGALDFDDNGTLYAISNGSRGPADIYILSTMDASPTFVGTATATDPDLPVLQGIDAIAFDSSGTLFAAPYSFVVTGTGPNDFIDFNRLLALDLTTIENGEVTADLDIRMSGPSGIGNAGAAGIAFNSAGQLFGSAGGSSGHPADLFSIDTTTGEQTAIGGTTNVISDIWFAADGTLYGASPNGDLFTIDPNPMSNPAGKKTFLFNTGIRISGLTGENLVAEVSEVDIDIKPWRFPNKIFPWYGLVSVAIFGSADFDVDDDTNGVDTTTLEFGPAGGAAFPWVIRGHDFSQPHDGYNDMIVFFRASRSGIKCGDTEAGVTGSTFLGNPIVFGTDSIVTVGCFKWRPPSRHRHRHRHRDDDDDDDDD